MTQLSDAPARTRAHISERTLRKDQWWRKPIITAVLLTIWVLYATVRVFTGHWYFVPQYHYLTPFYSPCVSGECVPGSSSLGTWIPAVPPIIPYAFVTLPFILGFRLTCYYYRGAYYKAFWADPPSCTVGEPRKRYLGEASFPLIMQNVHRFFLRLAEPILLVLAWDVFKATRFADPATGQTHFGIGVGTLVLAANVVLLGCYTLGCHSLRHLIGGRKDELSKSVALRGTAYQCVGCLNRRHMMWAWCSLCSVGFSDLYVRLCSMGIWTDWRLL